MAMDEGRALARELERALAAQGVEFAEAVRRQRPESGAGALEVAGGWAIYAGPGSPLSEARAMGLSGPVEEADLDRMETFLGRGGEPLRVEVVPLADPSLKQRLGARGYEVSELHNVLVRQLPDPLPEPAALSLQVRAIAPGEEEAWARTVMRGFAGEEEVDPETVQLILPTTRCPSTTCYGAFVGEEMVGAGSLAVHGRVAVLSGTGVRPAFRQRGAQAELIRVRLEAAQRAGAELAVSSTQPNTSSQRNLERAGFRVLYPKAVLVREP